MYHQKIVTLLFCNAVVTVSAFGTSAVDSTPHAFQNYYLTNRRSGIQVHELSSRRTRSSASSRLFMAEKNGIFDDLNNLIRPKKESPTTEKKVEESSPKSADTLSPGEKMMKDYKPSGDNVFQSNPLKAFKSKISPDDNADPPIANKVTDAAVAVDAQGPPKEVSSTNDGTNEIIARYSEDLNSSNPIKRVKAQFAIKAEEEAQKRRIARNKRIEQIESAKAKIFETRDSIQDTYETIVSLPSTIEKKVSETKESIDEISTKAKNTVEEVQKTPQKIKKTIDDTKRKVEDTKRATTEVVNDIKAIPGKVEKTVNDTKETVVRTKKGLDDFVSKVDDFTKSIRGSDESPRINPAQKSNKAASNTPQTIGEIDAGLELEVSEALDVAREALSKNEKNMK